MTPVEAVEVRVPASSANLGSGFDSLGLALGLYDVIEVRIIPRGLEITVDGEGADEVALDESHLVARALRAAGKVIGFQPPGLELRCRNAIPHSRGLGSSAAAAVAGVAAAYGLAGTEIDEHALQVAAEFEGHADNAAASLLGGLVVAWTEGDRYRAAGLDPHPAIRPVLLIPGESSKTSVTRRLLPDRVPHADAAFAAGRAALAVQAITARPDLLLPATADRLHQDYREAAWPASLRLVKILREHGLAAAVSGAGPTVMVLTADGKLPDGVDLSGFDTRELAVDRVGVQVRAI
ncbi:homoserine kinase [Kibdelosporangium phytohabitans]|uniref:Homoserine kinase n=1 Tax=Kibdelosporangium phytohabitans TaxID=860235 RepID=A0A0N9IAC0_9PSEU|nr:homoserine kinase [Kibdelosporangium phytohabitans]ALG13329.1 homoserine kinase [Kibdelosporangium phytohabitans]MBE1465112.1 homoserine kinase [Kibdelosporangium phytohabitans]